MQLVASGFAMPPFSNGAAPHAAKKRKVYSMAHASDSIAATHAQVKSVSSQIMLKQLLQMRRAKPR